MVVLLGIEEIASINDALSKEFEGEGLINALTKLNRTGQIGLFLEMLGFGYLMGGDSYYKPLRTGKIVVLGASEVPRDKLEGIGKSLGIDKSRFEFHLDYYEMKTKFDYKKLQYQPIYSLVVVGAMPHKTSGTGDYASAISAMQSDDGYPNIVKCYSGNRLKITKSSFREALEGAIKANYITIDY